MSEIRLGSDPEAKPIKIRAGQVVDVLYGGHFARSRRGIFGLDGNSDTLEYRPPPADSPEEAVKSTYKAVRRSKRRMLKHTQTGRSNGILRMDEEYGIAAGAAVGESALGGHIHLQLQGIAQPGNMKLQRLLTGLDFTLAVPMMMIQKQSSAQLRRITRNYGRLNSRQYEVPAWAHLNRNGIEYRVPESWLVAPKYAHAAFSAAYVVADAVQGGWTPPTFMRWTDHLQNDFHNCHKDTFAPLIGKIWREVKTMPRFNEVEAPLKTLFGEAALMEEWAEGTNILVAWDELKRRGRKSRGGREEADEEEGEEDEEEGTTTRTTRRRRRSRRNRLVGVETDFNVPQIVREFHSPRGIYVYGVAMSNQIRISTNTPQEVRAVVEREAQDMNARVVIGDVRGARGRIAIGFGHGLRQNVEACRGTLASIIEVAANLE